MKIKMKIHHKIAGIIIKNKKLLMVKKYDEPHFILPGGKIKENETKEQCLKRELKKELTIELKSMKEFKTWETKHFRDNYEELARENLSRAIAELTNQPSP